jgi:hypothetical protein
VHTSIHIQNKGMLRNNCDKNPYELWKGRPTNVNHFRVFGRKCYIKREYGRILNMPPKYSPGSKAKEQESIGTKYRLPGPLLGQGSIDPHF